MFTTEVEPINPGGPAPCPRFGHVCVLLDGSKLVLVGGARESGDKIEVLGDTWIFDLQRQAWTQFPVHEDCARHLARAAHAGALLSSRQLVIFGGASAEGPLMDDNLLRFCLDSGWTELPITGPTPGKRYGHVLGFRSPYLLLHGGNNGFQNLGDVWILDTERQPFAWQPIDLKGGPCPQPRCYHSAGICQAGSAQGMFVICGGRSDSVLNDMWGLFRHRNGLWGWTPAPSDRPISERYQHALVFLGDLLFVLGGRSTEGLPVDSIKYSTSACQTSFATPIDRYRHAVVRDPSSSRIYVIGGQSSQKSLHTEFLLRVSVHEYRASLEKSAGVRMSNYCKIGGPSGLHSVNLTDLQAEGLKINLKQVTNNVVPADQQSLHNRVVRELLKPVGFEVEHMEPGAFKFSIPEILSLCQAVLPILMKSETLIKVSAPVKIFGDLHGQYVDLMRFFSVFKGPFPEEGGDLAVTDYLFLGDYVDRGKHSLEIVCLLFALKIKHPRQIHLIRGNHEDARINDVYGFRKECETRLGDATHSPNSVWQTINQVFSWLPLGAVINGRILCLHGGIGQEVHKLSDIASIRRPVTLNPQPSTPYDQRITDILWSDPTSSDEILGTQVNKRRDPSGVSGITKFGPDRVHTFLKNNKPIDLIIRAHECVMDGIQRFAQGKLITLFSATDYCGTYQNAGAMLFIQKNNIVIPQLIYPQERLRSLSHVHWDDDVSKARPPTPPRTPIRK